MRKGKFGYRHSWRKNMQEDTQEENGYVNTEAEIGVMYLQTNE